MRGAWRRASGRWDPGDRLELGAALSEAAGSDRIRTAAAAVAAEIAAMPAPSAVLPVLAGIT